MEKDLIAEVGIDQTGRFYITLSSVKFPFIHREAMKVNLDVREHFPHSPRPPKALQEWTYFEWFKQITYVAQEQGYSLRISNTTKWNNVPEPLKKEILEWVKLHYSNFNE